MRCRPLMYLVVLAMDLSCHTSVCPTIGCQTCTSSGFELVGVDLGHGDNSNLPISVSLDGSSPILVQASLAGIQNSRDCDLVCYSHQGVVNN